MQALSSRQCSSRLGSRTGARRPARQQVKTLALFGWGKSSEKDSEKEEQFRIQQELLKGRRDGSLIQKANERRAKVSETLKERKEARRLEREALARGEMPTTLDKWQPYSKETNARANSGIVVPLLPFGLRKYDEGERFDLRSPYSDDGWVDPSETDMWAGFKKIGSKILNFDKNKNFDERGKKIIWASEYDKYKKEQGKGKK